MSYVYLSSIFIQQVGFVYQNISSTTNRKEHIKFLLKQTTLNFFLVDSIP